MRRELGRLKLFWQYGHLNLPEPELEPEPAGDSKNWLGGDADPDLSESASSSVSIACPAISEVVAEIARRCDCTKSLEALGRTSWL
jgi:hypothetical protein